MKKILLISIIALTFASCNMSKKYDIDEVQKAYLEGWKKGYIQSGTINTMDPEKYENEWDESQMQIDASFYVLDLIRVNR